MKNIHVIKTDKPSRFTFRKDYKYYRFRKDEFVNNNTYQNQNIYITSDEEIKEGDWCLSTDKNFVIKLVNAPAFKCDKKIILTTDQDLIKDGVQAIDDEFLEWFVKNPSCEWVEVKVEFIQTPDNLKDGFYYKPIIPNEESYQVGIDWSGFPNSTQEKVGYLEPKKCICFNELEYQECCAQCEDSFNKKNPKQTVQEYEQQGLEKHSYELEPKQETVEEAAERAVKSGLFKDETLFIAGTRWQQEQDKNKYSEEEIKLAMKNSYGMKYFSETKFFKNLKQFKP